MSRKSLSIARQTRKKLPDIKKRILIVTEGTVTEPEYFTRVKKIADTKQISLVIKPSKNYANRNTDPVSIVRECLRYRDEDKTRNNQKKHADIHPYQDCYAIVDYDQWDTPNRNSILKQACRLAKKHGIKLLVTRLKFEVWLLWHLDGVTPGQTSRELDIQCEKHSILNKKSLSPSFIVDSQTCRRAINNAGKTGYGNINQIPPKSPSSAIPRLFETLQLS